MSLLLHTVRVINCHMCAHSEYTVLSLMAALQKDANRMDVSNQSGLQKVWPGLAADSLVALQAAISVMLSDKLTWFPEFGCALLALGRVGPHGPDSRPDLDALSIHLLCLDSWKFKIHRWVHILDQSFLLTRITTWLCIRGIHAGTHMLERHSDMEFGRKACATTSSM